ncbi:hypothetical protein FACS189450_15170 [Spirochaetia bacterium]|nr:hypothetical protein FACS189450_15170 [Spirochaetia bacterium]
MIKAFARPMGIPEAVEFTGLSKNYLYKLIHLGKIPCYKPLGKKIFFKQEELEAFIFRGKQSADFELSAAADQLVNGGR